MFRPVCAQIKAIVLGTLALASAACAAPPARLAPAAFPAVAPAVASAPSALPADVVFVIPPGAAAAQMRGDPDAFRLPAEMHVVVGQRIVVRNEDQAMHYFFYLPIAPGQAVFKAFDQPGQYGYSTIYSCSLAGEVDTLSVHVAPRGATK
jgi:hypothetical protein